jgi:hypothetical protein
MVDVLITDYGTKCTFHLKSNQALDWWSYHIPDNNYTAERTYANDIYCGMVTNGLSIKVIRLAA